MIVPEFLSTSGDINADRRFEFAKGLAEDDGDFLAAIDLLEQTRDLVPSWPVLPFTLGKYYKALARHEEAIACFKLSQELDPEDRQGAALELERLGVQAITDNMPPAFVETLFDQYAERFDHHLVEVLDYSVPDMIARAAGQYYSASLPIPILDLGCGTGLAGEHLKPLASNLMGVDLSSGMLDQARDKALYDTLVQAELVDYLQQFSDHYPLIVAADVLIYFGALDSVFETIKSRLCAGGHFIFSVQALADPPPDPEQPQYYLGRARRFSHGKDYLTKSIAASGLQLLELKSVILRKDEGQDVQGYLIVCTV